MLAREYLCRLRTVIGPLTVQLYVQYFCPRLKHAGFHNVNSQISLPQHVWNVPYKAKPLGVLESQAGQKKKEVPLIFHPVLYNENRHRFRRCVGST